MKKFLISSVLVFAPLFLLAYVSPGSPQGFVNDYANLLAVEEKTELESVLTQFEKDSSNEISVVTIKSLQGDTIENYAEKLFQEWGIGKAKDDNGVLLLIALEDREMRIEVGYGLEGALPDATASSIIRNTLTPAFQEENYYEGISSAVVEMISATKGEYTPVSSSIDYESIPIEFFGFLIFVVPMWFASILGRSKSWWAGGVIGGVGGIVLTTIFGFLYVGIFAIPFLVFLGLLFDYMVSKGYQRGLQSGHIPWWTGGGKGGGFGGGGFGGFGGGMSGGGGSSGRW
ncbi:MAG: hypothetical protein RJA61_641 [Candidatus Parcubacteria bacterium]|jgi:uncharacterized protein